MCLFVFVLFMSYYRKVQKIPTTRPFVLYFILMVFEFCFFTFMYLITLEMIFENIVR